MSGSPTPRGVADRVANALRVREAEPQLTIKEMAARCGIGRTTLTDALAVRRAPKGPGQRERDLDILRLLYDDMWLRPMDIGGRDGSHHSDSLARLVRAGLAERSPRGGHSKTAWQYRRTPAGRSAAGVAC